MILPAPLRSFVPVLGTGAAAKFRGGAGEIISPASSYLNRELIIITTDQGEDDEGEGGGEDQE